MCASIPQRRLRAETTTSSLWVCEMWASFTSPCACTCMNKCVHLHVQRPFLVHTVISSPHVNNFPGCPGRTCLQIRWSLAWPQHTPYSTLAGAACPKAGLDALLGQGMMAEPFSPGLLLATETT